MSYLTHDFPSIRGFDFGFPLTEIPIELPRLHPMALSSIERDLDEEATQSGFNLNPVRSNLMIVGEQPADAEGRPFVGRAGKILDNALDEAGIDRAELYVTNAVKHSKYKTPTTSEIDACRLWLEAEIRVVQPYVVVCLGEIAARSLFQRAVRIPELRGGFHATGLAAQTYVTVHPSSLLGAADSTARDLEYARFVSDLRRVARKVRELERKAG